MIPELGRLIIKTVNRRRIVYYKSLSDNKRREIDYNLACFELQI